MIIDGKDINGQRKSISINEYLWKFVEAEKGDDAKKWLRENMRRSAVVNSQWALTLVTHLIAKPSLSTKVLGVGDDQQMDIEDI